VPAAVRTLAEGVEQLDLVGQGSNRGLSGKMAAIASGAASARPQPLSSRPAERRRRRPWGEMRRAIEAVLGSAGEMRARDIRPAVEQLLGQEVTASSVKNCLAANSRGTAPSFVRVGRGRYRLA
jgi:hypothetical protein